MRRRALLTLPALAGAAFLPHPAAAQAAIATEEFSIPAPGGGELFLRSKRPEGMQPAPGRTLVFVHNGTYPAHTSFDLPLIGISWMDYIAARGFDVWSLDLGGYGRSSRPAGMSRPPEGQAPLAGAEAALAELAAAVGFVRERRGLPRLGLMGWGWGCSLVGRFAVANPQQVERIVMQAPLWPVAGQAAPPADPPAQPLGAWRGLTQREARAAWVEGVPEAARAALIPPGWFEHWAGLTWATDPEGGRRNPPVLRVPNGALADGREGWQAGRPPFDAARITAPALLVAAEWDREAPPAMATALFTAMTASPGRRCVLLGEGTHMMALERNRGALFQAVQVFLEEARS